MKLKKLGIKGKLVSTEQTVFTLFRLLGNLRNENTNVSSSHQTFMVSPYARVALLEAQLRKEEAKAYWRRMDPPK